MHVYNYLLCANLFVACRVSVYHNSGVVCDSSRTVVSSCVNYMKSPFTVFINHMKFPFTVLIQPDLSKWTLIVSSYVDLVLANIFRLSSQ